MTILNMKFSKPFLLLLIVSIWAGIYLPGLGKREIQGNEPKRVLPAMTMIETGNWITPELAGEQYYKKPPLVNWIIATSFLILGDQSELAARLPSAISVLCFVLLLVLMPSACISYEGRFISAIAFLTSAGIVDKGRLIEIDALYASITGIAVLLWLNMRSPDYPKWLMWPLVGLTLGLGLLLKGPVILLFFYLTVIFILRHEKKLKELVSLRHMSGIFAMLAVFLAWALTAYAMKPHATEVEKKTTMGGEWISDVLDCMVGMDKLDIVGWAVNLGQALTYFLPWLLFFPLLRNKECMAEIPEDKRRLLHGLMMATVSGFILVSLMPGTRARYFVPLISTSCILTGLLLSSIALKKTACNVWKNALLAFSLLSILSLAAGVCLVNMRYAVPMFKHFKVETTSPLEFSHLVPALGTAAATLGVFILIYRSRRRICDSLTLPVLTGLLTVVLSLQYACFALPVMKQFEVKRPFGTEINRFLPPDEPVYLFNFGISNYKPFLYYIRPPVKYIFEYDEITDKVNYALFDADLYGKKLFEPGTVKRKPLVLTNIKLKKRKYILVQFTEPVPALK
ncbi:MAG: glycosyltransferase family 39 protein [Victivallales bacterium]|jgi:4-amino-4-deoxy-L-arabinose transferase-like glycosyltransferase